MRAKDLIGKKAYRTNGVLRNNGREDRSFVGRDGAVLIYNVDDSGLITYKSRYSNAKCDLDPEWNDDNWEEFKEDELKLMDLVLAVNAGRDAMKVIKQKYAGEVEYDNGGSFVDGSSIAEHAIRIRKPKFAKFDVEVGDSRWTIDVTANRINIDIGCKTFPIVYLKKALQELIVDNAGYSKQGGYDFFGTKTGVRYDRNTLPWEHAERILKQLKEMENK